MNKKARKPAVFLGSLLLPVGALVFLFLGACDAKIVISTRDTSCLDNQDDPSCADRANAGKDTDSETESETSTTVRQVNSTGINAATLHAILDNSPSLNSNVNTLDIDVSGTGVFEFKYAILFGATDCSGASYSGFLSASGASNITDSLANGAGSYRLCIIAKSVDGIVQATPTEYAWTYNSTLTIASALITAADSAGGADTHYDDDTTIYFAWTAGSDSGSGLRDYTLQRFDLANCTGTSTDTTGIVTTSQSYVGSSGSTYSFRIVTFNNNNESATSVCSGNLTIDTSAPTGATSLVTAADSGAGADTRYDDDMGIYFAWAAGSDAESGIASYTLQRYDLSSCGGASTDTASATSPVSFTGTNGSTYSFKVGAINNAGLSTTSACSGDITIDTSAPTSASSLITAADSGAGADTRYDDDTGIYFAWTAGSDAESGIASYTLKRYAQGSCGGTATDVAGATSPVSFTGVSGTTYSFKIVTINGGGGSTTSACSGDIIIDTTNPSPATSVNDGSTSSLSASPTITWVAGSDVGGSGINHYEVAIGTSAGGTQTVSWTDVGNVLTYAFSGLTLVDATTYYATVRAVDNAGNISTAANSDGWTATYTGPVWAQEAYLKAPNAEASDAFGRTVAVSGDTVVVGAYLEDSSQTTITTGTTASSDNMASSSGAAYVFKRTGATWAQEAYLKAPNANTSDWFGGSVAVSQDTIAVGAHGESSNQTTITNGTTASANNAAFFAGAVYVFKRTGTTWSQEAYLKAPNSQMNDFFGYVVAVSSDTVAVGAFPESSNQTTITNGTTASADNSVGYSGAVYVFKRTGATWAQQAYIKAPNAEASDNFGEKVAVSGDMLVVAASGEDSNQTTITNGTTASADNSAAASGAVYIFKRTGNNWAQEAYVKASNAEAGDSFSSSIAINSDTVAVGAYYEDSNQTTVTNGTSASADNSAANAGAVYIFKRTGSNWAQEAYLKASNAEASDYFGCSVAVFSDTVVVGAFNEDSSQTTVTNGTGASTDNSVSASGAAYVFKRNGSSWDQEAYLKAPNADSMDYFGTSVSLSFDTIVVGASGERSIQTSITNGPTASSDNSATDVGAAYVFKRTYASPTWSQEAYVKASNADASDTFGVLVAVSSDTMVVGAFQESSNQITITNGTTSSADNSASSAGAVYVYKRTGSTWAQEAYLKASNAEASDNFGIAAAVSLDTIAVGARNEDSNQTTITNGTSSSANNSAANAGAVYVYKRTGTTWAQEAYLKASNAGASDNFGYAVSISSDTIVVGASLESSNQTTITNGTTSSADDSASGSGAVYVYKRTGSTWAQEAYIKASNANNFDYFGQAVSVSNDTIAVGARFEDSNQTTITNGTTSSADNSAGQSGAVYVYKRTGSTWAQEAYLKASNAQASDYFGQSVALNADTIAVGAYREDSNQTTITNGATSSADNSLSDSGAVYVYKRTGTTWAQEAFLKASNAENFDYFGFSVSMSSDTIAVGAYQEDSNQTTVTNGSTSSADNSALESGAVYVYKRSVATWAQEAYLKAPNPDSLDYFGYSVTVSSDTVAVGAYEERSSQTTITNGSTASSNNSAVSAGAVYIFKRN